MKTALIATLASISLALAGKPHPEAWARTSRLAAEADTLALAAHRADSAAIVYRAQASAVVDAAKRQYIRETGARPQDIDWSTGSVRDTTERTQP